MRGTVAARAGVASPPPLLRPPCVGRLGQREAAGRAGEAGGRRARPLDAIPDRRRDPPPRDGRSGTRGPRRVPFGRERQLPRRPREARRRGGSPDPGGGPSGSAALRAVRLGRVHDARRRALPGGVQALRQGHGREGQARGRRPRRGPPKQRRGIRHGVSVARALNRRRVLGDAGGARGRPLPVRARGRLRPVLPVRRAKGRPGHGVCAGAGPSAASSSTRPASPCPARS